MTGEELFSWYCNQKRTKGYVPLIKLIDKEMAKQKIDNALQNLPCADCIKFSIKIIDIIDELKEIRAEISKV